ncbi:MAG: dihydrofolate reductase family protein, partial [Planctomycetota bacterium]
MTGNAQAPPSTGRVRLYLAASVDGYIASPDGGVEWLEGYGDAEGDAATFMKSIGGAIMGRATYDFAVSHPWMLGSMPVAVLTHRSLEDPPPGVFAVSGDLTKVVQRIRGQSTGDIWLMGGGHTNAAML